MLQNIRNNIQGVIAKIIIGLIIIPFAVFGIDSLVGGGGPVSVAEVNGVEVTEQELQRAIDLQKRRLMNMMGENADPAMFDDDLLRAPALEQLIQQKLMLQAAEDASIGISSEALDQAIVNMPQFQEDGQFSPQLYQNILRSNGLTSSYFKLMLSNDMVVNQLNSGLAASDFVTEKELEETAKVVGQKRSFRYFILPYKKVASGITISDEDVNSYYEANINNFQTDNRVKLEYIEVKQQDFFKPVQPEELEQAYELEMADFQADERRRASHILLEITDERGEQQTKELAQSLVQRIKDGEDFAKLAGEFSDDLGSASAGGDLGFSSGDTFPEEFEQALFSLEHNAVSPPVLTDAGYHLIRATEISNVDKPSFDERKAVIEQRIQLAAAEVEFVAKVEELRDRVFNSEDLSDPASELELKVSVSDWVTQTTGPGVLGNKIVLAAAFSDDILQDGNNSEVLELASDHYIVIRVKEHQPPKAKPLAEVKDSIIASLTKQKASTETIKLAQEAVSELSGGTALEDIARGHDYQWQVELAVTRNSANVPRELITAAFDMSVVPEGDLVIKTVPMDNGDAAVLQLEKVEDGSWSDFSSPQQRGISAELQRNFATKSINAFISSIRSAAQIDIL